MHTYPPQVVLLRLDDDGPACSRDRGRGVR